MSIREEYDGNDLILWIEGRVDSSNGEEFTNQLTAACRKSSMIKLELSQVSYFASAGLRGLIMAYKSSNALGGRIELYGVNDVLFKTFQDTGLDQSMIIHREGLASTEG